MMAGMVGCDHDNAIAPNPGNNSGVASIELRLSQSELRGFSGEVRTETITAIARDGQGVAVPEAEISFAIRNPQPWKGTISTSQAQPQTDENGQLEASYSVSIDQTADVVIEAYAGQVLGTANLSIIVVNDIIGSISIESSTQVLAVPPNQTRNATVTASLVDVDGNALPGMQVSFRTDSPGLGFVDGEHATTDFNGRASRTFTSIVNKYGLCEISALVGDYSDKTTIEIRPVEAPANVNLTTENPVVKVSQGQNATINLDAVVTDAFRVGVPSTKVAFEALPIEEGAETFGSLSYPDTTNQEGRVTAQFSSLGEYGLLKVKVRVLPSEMSGSATEDEDEITAEIFIEVKELTIDIGSLTVRAFPDFLKLSPDTNGESNIRAQVRDVNNVGIPDVRVDFMTDLGALSQSTVTDEAGVATAVFHNNYEAGVATITATVPGTGHLAVEQITIEQSAGATGSLTLNADKEFIYADNGLTYASLTALLSDEDGQALSGKEITFTKTHGTVNSPVLTDSLGIARAIFRDVGSPSYNDQGLRVPAIITARYNPLGLNANVEITIYERNPVASITLQSAAEQMIAGGQNPVTIRATCFLENGNYAPEGTLVRFEVDMGHFSEDAVAVMGNFGVAETQYYPGSLTGIARLKAYVQNGDETVESNEVIINLLPGPASTVTVSATPSELITNDPDSFASIIAVVSDTVNNPVAQGTLVRFSTTLGNITPTAITDENGHAEVRLVPELEAGTAVITATVETPSGGEINGSATVTFISGRPNSIELFADPGQVAVAGTAGNSTSTIRAEVRDANGNLVGIQTPVTFELMHEPPEPEGCNFNDHGQSDVSMTNNGIATVSLNAGTQIGGKVIRAYTYRDEEQQDTVSVVLSTMAVISGPAHSLDIDLNDEGDDADGGAWRIEVSARVYDMHHNPVANNLPVVFSVEPEIASISAGFTGNESWANESEPGLAYATLTYQSSETFSDIVITAAVATQDGQISGEKEHILPLQDGVLELYMDPGNWMFERQRPNDECNIRVWAVLKDGHQALINNAPILFRSEKGMFSWLNFQTGNFELFYPDIVRKYSGVVSEIHNEESGQATVYMIGVMDDFFLEDFSVTASCQIEAYLEGYEDVQADPKFIIFNRH